MANKCPSIMANMLFERKEKTQLGMSHLRCGEEEEFQITLNMFHP